MADGCIYRPYKRLLSLRLLGRDFEVPENNILLRCFQFVAPGVPYGPFCWNGDCKNDRIQYREAGCDASRSGLACQTLIAEGMVVEAISAELARVLSPALAATPAGGIPHEASPDEAGSVLHGELEPASTADRSSG